MANNFKVWAEDNDKLLSQEEFEAASKDGFKAGDLLSAQKINTILRQNSLMSTALANYLSKNNKNAEVIDYNSKESDIAAILENVLSSSKASAPIKITLNRDKWTKVLDDGAIWFQDVVIPNFSPYDNVVIGNPVQQTIKLWDTTIVDTTIATEWSNVFQTVTFRKIVDEVPYCGIRLYATKDLAVNLIIPIRTFSSNNDIVSGLCLLTHEATNELFDDNGFCTHTNSITEEMINTSASAFGREDTICAQCGYLSTELLAPTAIAKTATECKHTGDKVYIPIKDYKHVTLCADCMQVINTVEHSWRWDTDEKGHWQICEDCGYIISKPIAHTWEKNPDAPASSPYPDMYYKLEIGVDEDGNPIYSQDYHYVICDICGYKHYEEHAWSNNNGKCAKCGQQHTHEFENYSRSTTQHYLKYKCKNCHYYDDRYGSENHSIDKRFIPHSVDKHKIEAYCKNCDYIAEISSSSIETNKSQLSNHNIATLDLGNGYHKYYCIDCDWVQNIEAHHSFNEDGECTICNGEIHVHVWEYSDNHDGTHSAICQIDSSHIIASEAHELKDNQCTKCDYVYVTPDDPPSHVHESTSGWVSDPTTFHYKVCSICGESYDFALHDTRGSAKSYSSNYHYPHSCSVCGQGLDIEACNKDGGTKSISATQHATYCSICSNHFDTTDHTFAARFSSEEHWQECTVCGYTTEKIKHSIAQEYSYSDAHHWKQCSGCDYKIIEPHITFVTKQTPLNHWQECQDCGYQKNKSPHTFGSWGSIGDTHTRSCTGCNRSETHIRRDDNNDTVCDICNLPNYIN